MMPPRTYWVGLPVGVTVHDDGTVEYEIDTAEAGSAVRELLGDSMGIEEPDEDLVLADADLIDHDHERRHA